jgi:hypothetical protein
VFELAIEMRQPYNKGNCRCNQSQTGASVKGNEMPLVSVPAVYDGKEIRLLEPSPVRERYRVLVTFVEPAGDETAAPTDRTRFWRSLGAWQDDRPIKDILRS